MKSHTKLLCLLSLVLCLLFVTGCSFGTSSEEEIKPQDILLENMANVQSVETDITLFFHTNIGAQGESSAHNASLESNISLQMTAEPLAVHGEYYSRVYVDGVESRDDKEYYVVPKDHGYAKYVCEGNDEWEHNTLTQAQTLAIPAQTGLIYNWNNFLSYLKDDQYTTSIDGIDCYQMSGQVPANILQEFFFDNNVFGSFMYSTEMLLNDNIPCVLLVDAATNYPYQLVLNFKDCFIVSDMYISEATVTVEYSNWNGVSEIKIPKKVDVVATDPTVDFYNSYVIWNLFLPYVTGESGDSNDPNGSVSFTADWSTFQVRIDGSMTKLPIQPSDLIKMGYNIDSSYRNTLIEPNKYMERIPLIKGSDIIYCTFYNPDTAAKSVADSPICAIDLSYSDNAGNSIKIYLPGEITLGSTRDSLISAYGQADLVEEAFAADTYTWYGESTGTDENGEPIINNNQSFIAEVSTVNNQVIRIYLKDITVTGGTQ